MEVHPSDVKRGLVNGLGYDLAHPCILCGGRY